MLYVLLFNMSATYVLRQRTTGISRYYDNLYRQYHNEHIGGFTKRKLQLVTPDQVKES